MTNEEKAKAYDEAIVRGSQLWESDTITRETYEYIFPELAESEDERIRKDMIYFLEEQRKAGGLNRPEWIAYLEKQKPANYIPKFKVGDKVISTKNAHLTYDILEVGLINELGNPEYRVEILTDEHSDTPPNIKLIECQKMDSWGELVEQKPASKPKIYDSIEDLIADALIEEIEDSELPESAKHNRIHWIKTHRQKPAEWSEEDKKFINSLCNLFPAIAKNNYVGGYYAPDLVNRLKSLCPQTKQEWSEEDEKFFRTALWHISYSVSNGKSTDDHCATTDWLKGVKERLKSLRPQPKRRDTYYDIIHDILAMLKDKDFTQITPQYRVSLLNDIRVKCKNADECAEILDEPQWKPSEEQIRILGYLVETLDVASHDRHVIDNMIDDLKKL